MSKGVQEKAIAGNQASGTDKPKAASKTVSKAASRKTTTAVKKTAPAKKAAAVKKPATAPKTVAKAPVKAVKAVKQAAAQEPATGKSAKPAKSVKPASREKLKKPKLVRDSFTMPESEYQVLGDVKKAFLKIGISVKKSELLRAGVALIKAMETAKLKTVIAGLPPIKAGRPKKDK